MKLLVKPLKQLKYFNYTDKACFFYLFKSLVSLVSKFSKCIHNNAEYHLNKQHLYHNEEQKIKEPAPPEV
jgi:hypothetical protein